jgi:hypothetical protein
MKSITQSISFGVMASIVALTTLVLPFTSFAAVTNWKLTAPTPLIFMCGTEYDHTIQTINQDANGNLTGTGSYDSNTAYTWDLDGTVVGNNIDFSITYTGLSSGSVYNLSGVIAQDGSVTGTVDSNCQTFTMPAGSLVVANPETSLECKKGGWENYGFKNQGQCVRYVETEKDSR